MPERSSPTAKKDATPQLTPTLGLPPRTSCHTLEIWGGGSQERWYGGTVSRSPEAFMPIREFLEKGSGPDRSRLYRIHRPPSREARPLWSGPWFGYPQFKAALQSLLSSAVFWTTSPAFCQLHPMSPVKGSNTSDIATGCLFGPSFLYPLGGQLPSTS